MIIVDQIDWIGIIEALAHLAIDDAWHQEAWSHSVILIALCVKLSYLHLLVRIGILVLQSQNVIDVIKVFPDFENAFVLIQDGWLVLDASCLASAISVGEVAALGIILILVHLIIIVYHLVLEDHSVDLALILRSVILHAFFY